MDCDTIIQIASEICLDKTYSDYLCQFIEENREVFTLLDKMSELAREKLISSFDEYQALIQETFECNIHPQVNLYYAVLFAGQCKKEFTSKGINHDVYRETMSDINIWASSYHRKTGKIGLEEIGWIRHHIRGDLYRLGRLQFEMGFFENSPCLHIHIPEGGKLDFDECRKSIARAKPFFEKHLSCAYTLAVCHSWLLHKSLKEILGSNSNILNFANLFEIIENDNDQKQAMERVFGAESDDLKYLPEHTSLQRKLKSHLQGGNSIGMGLGIIRLTSNN